MDLTENSRPSASPPGVATHVVAWLPPYLARTRRWPLGRRPAAGWWDLQEIAAYDAGEPPPGGDWSWDGPRDEDPLRLANWAALVLGHPVALDADIVSMRPGWPPLPWRRWRPEPVYWVASRAAR